MAAVRAMAIICDTVLLPLLRAVKPGADKHVLDVLPKVWPRALEFFRDAAARPRGLVDDDLRLDLGEVAGVAAGAASASQARRSERAHLDMLRVCAKAKGDAKAVRALALARRQEMPEEAFITVEELKRHQPESYAIRLNRVAVAACSYCTPTPSATRCSCWPTRWRSA